MIKILTIGVFVSVVSLVRCQVGFGGGSSVPGVCVCATSNQCSAAGGGAANDGTGQLDARILGTGTTSGPTGTTDNTGIGVIGTGIGLVAWTQGVCDSPAGMERCCPPVGYTCGIRYPPIQGATPPTGSQAAFGAYPYQAALLTASNIFLGSAVLIDHFHALTAAHKLNVSAGATLKIRMGDWDLSSANEVIPFMEFQVLTVTIHPNYTVGNLKNNIAILTLLTPVPLGQFPTINNICLPNTTIPSNIRCMVAGWGRNDPATGTFQSIIREVDVPLVPFDTCQTQLRATKLGPNFMLDGNSFICAGGEAGKDACIGDGGGPLACMIFDRWFLVGLTAWGIGCGQPNVPGVYVNVQTYVPWMQAFIASENRIANRSITTTSTTRRAAGGIPTTLSNDDSSSMAQTTKTMGGSTASTPSTTSGSAASTTRPASGAPAAPTTVSQSGSSMSSQPTTVRGAMDQSASATPSKAGSSSGSSAATATPTPVTTRGSLSTVKGSEGTTTRGSTVRSGGSTVRSGGSSVRSGGATVRGGRTVKGTRATRTPKSSKAP